MRKFLAENPSEFDPRKYLAQATEAMKQICLQRYQAFGSVDQASKIVCKNLEQMANIY